MLITIPMAWNIHALYSTLVATVPAMALACIAPAHAAQQPDATSRPAAPSTEVSKALAFQSSTPWAERAVKLGEFGYSRVKELQRKPRPYGHDQLKTGVSTADSQVLLEAEMASMAREMAERLQRDSTNPLFAGATHVHSSMLLPGRKFRGSSSGTFLLVMMLMCEDLPAYDVSGKNLLPWPSETDLADRIRAHCRELLNPELVSKSQKLMRDQVDFRELAPEFKSGMLKDVQRYAALCEQRRWQEAQAIGDVYWAALRNALTEGTVVLPAFGSATGPEEQVTPPAASRPTASEVLAWIEQERMGVELARGSAPGGEYHVWQTTRSRYGEFLDSLRKRIEADRETVTKARAQADELERAGLTDAARDLRESITRKEQEPIFDVGAEIQKFARQGANQPDVWLHNSSFYLISFERPDSEISQIFAGVERTIESLRERVVNARRAVDGLAGQKGNEKSENVSHLQGQEGFAIAIIEDLQKLLAAHRAGDSDAMRVVLGPRRLALHNSEDVPTLTGRPPAPSAKPPQFRMCTIDVDRARLSRDRAEQRVSEARKAMQKTRNRFPAMNDHLALWRAQSELSYYRAVLDHLKKVEPDGNGTIPTSWRLIDLPDGGGEYSFARFDPAMLATAAGLKACRDRWQARLEGTRRSIEKLVPREAMPEPREELAAHRALAADIEQALQLLSQGEHDKLTQFLDGIWARVTTP